ncbi:MAG: hypothetical protein J0L55_13820 [Caulobacterales bacterium]|nr:hypothetical protein [Caulobacterales bacterium]
MKQFIILVGAFFTLIASPVFADVIEAKETGFKIVQNYEIKTKSNKLFKQLIMPKNWWSSNHTWSQNAKNLYIEPYANGCFCEKLINNGSVMHMKIVYFAKTQGVRTTGKDGSSSLDYANFPDSVLVSFRGLAMTQAKMTPGFGCSVKKFNGQMPNGLINVGQ